MSKTATLSTEEQILQHETAVAQANRQVSLLEERNRALAGFQSEAVDSRDVIAKLQAALEAETVRADTAVKEAAAANAAAKDAASVKSASNARVVAALELVAALKKLG